MVSCEYLVKGLNAMSRAHQVNAMAGHLGAAVVAGYLIAVQHPDLDDRVYAGIEGELDRITRGESVFSPGEGSPVTVADMFGPYPREQPKPELVDDIAEALAHNIGETRESGHNVIFASIAIRAFKDYPDLATPSVAGGIRQLITLFDGSKPGSGYYGRQRGRINGREIPLPTDHAFPSHASLPAMADVVLGELIRCAGERRDGFGGLWHVINHAAALVELHAYGYGELAIQGLHAHHQHMRLFRTVPDVADELGKETPTEHDPRTPTYWTSGPIRRDRARLSHRIKTLYGFDVLADGVRDEAKREQANEKLRYLM